MEERRSLRGERIAKGMCPNCGAEAAPHYLCGKCRLMAKVGRIVNRAAKVGGVVKSRHDGAMHYSMGDREAWDRIAWRPDPKEGDGRLRPRLGRIPVDVGNEIVGILTSLGRPATIDEIVAAWGRLREERRRGSIAGDMVAIIEAQRRRNERNLKRLRHHQGLADAQA